MSSFFRVLMGYQVCNLTLDVVDIADACNVFYKKINVNTADGSDLIQVLEIYRERCSTLVKLAQDIAFFTRISPSTIASWPRNSSSRKLSSSWRR